jgi:16S rRNA (uracil1498-N3)-methyltransferase
VKNKYLNNIQLYYSLGSNIANENAEIIGEEARHIVKVMRNKKGDEIFITNGSGSIFKTSIEKIDGDKIKLKLFQEYEYENRFKNIHFCLPKLKNPDRLEFALEKCTELGITKFLIFSSERTIKKGNKTERWEKILLSAMKQSLRSFLPDLKTTSLKEISMLEGKKILFTQESVKRFDFNLIPGNTNYYFIFGPEGDFTKEEFNLFVESELFNLGENRLRSETAIIKCASLL